MPSFLLIFSTIVECRMSDFSVSDFGKVVYVENTKSQVKELDTSDFYM